MKKITIHFTSLICISAFSINLAIVKKTKYQKRQKIKQSANGYGKLVKNGPVWMVQVERRNNRSLAQLK